VRISLNFDVLDRMCSCMLTSQNNKTQKKSNKTSAELKHVMELQSYTTGEHRCDNGLFWPWHRTSLAIGIIFLFFFFLIQSCSYFLFLHVNLQKSITKSFKFRKISIIYKNLQKNKIYLIEISNKEYFKYLNKFLEMSHNVRGFMAWLQL
jgi:hypothetical protein